VKQELATAEPRIPTAAAGGTGKFRSGNDPRSKLSLSKAKPSLSSIFTLHKGTSLC